MVRVSVVIPVYNIAPHLRQCLDSVVSQTLRDIEIICVDDGSTDESPAILAEYAKNDPRVHVITQENAGPGVARNTGMAQVAGEYLIFLDSDDWFEPELLERMTSKAQETDADIVICKTMEFDTNTGKELQSDWMLKTNYLPRNIFTPKEIAPHIFQFTYGWPWDKLYRTDFVRKARLSYPPLRNSEDLVFVFQSLAEAVQIAVLDEVLIHHRVNRKNSVSNSRHQGVEAPYEALCLFRDGLRQRGCYEIFEQSFLNWAMEFLVWNAANLPDQMAQRNYFEKLRQEYFPALGFADHPVSYYQSKNHYLKYLLAKCAPFPVFRGIVNFYHHLKR